jgi:exopolysaccharide biosynthesis WecB/TagA/CpsF family protein
VPLTKTEFMGLTFDCGSQKQWLDEVVSASGEEPFSFLVTPNADHMVRYLEGGITANVYEEARFHVCDSRILNLLARRVNKDLQPVPGSDLVRTLLEARKAQELSIAIVGPSEEDFDALRARYPDLRLDLIPSASRMEVGDPAWRACHEALMSTEFDLLLICLGFPKQEYMAHGLMQDGKTRGLGLCVGASIDFLTGKQKRAPVWMQRMHLEWLHRLGSQPRRLGRRYLVDGPRIFRHFRSLERQGPQ